MLSFSRGHSLFLSFSLYFVVALSSAGYAQEIAPMPSQNKRVMTVELPKGKVVADASAIPENAPLISPEDARAIIDTRVIEGNLIRFDNQTTSTSSALTSSGSLSTQSMSASTAVPSVIVELARSLKNDPDRMFEYVHNNIKYTLGYGLKKSPEATIRDGSGNAWDQANLLMALLKESPDYALYEVGFSFGDVFVRAGNLQSRLDLNLDYSALQSTSDILGNLFANAGMPVGVYIDAFDRYVTTVETPHINVLMNKVVKNNLVPYRRYDPSFMNILENWPGYMPVSGTGIDIELAMGWDLNSFTSISRSNVVTGPSGEYKQGYDRNTIRDLLKTYSSNLSNYIDSNMNGANIIDLFGGFNPQAFYGEAPLMLAQSLYYSGQEQLILQEIPDTERSTIRVLYTSIDVTFFADEIYGKRLTIVPDANYAPVLYLDGQVVATGTSLVPDGTTYGGVVVIDHPYAAYSGTWGDSTFNIWFDPTASYALVNTWGEVGRGQIEHHREKLRTYRENGLADDSEAVVGESLQLLGLNYFGQLSQFSNLTDKTSEMHTIEHHTFALVGNDGSISMDILSNLKAQLPASNGSVGNADAYKMVFGGFESVFESGFIEQALGIESVSSISILDHVNEMGQKLFLTVASNYSTVQPQLSNYSANDMNSIINLLNAGNLLILPESGNTTINDWQGPGYIAYNGSFNGAVYAISRWGWQGNGGHGTIGLVESDWLDDVTNNGEDNNEPKDCIGDPIDMTSGNFYYDNVDLTLGSADANFGLDFQRLYSSGNNRKSGVLGRGWKHNYDISVSRESDGFQGLGWDNPVDAASTIVAFKVSFELAKSFHQVSAETDLLIENILVQDWFMSQLTDNVVKVELPDRTKKFVENADGSYSPSQVCSDTLTNGQVAGTFEYKTNDGTILSFDVGGKVSSIIDRNNNSMNFSYDLVENLKAVSNSFGRQLDLTYAGGQLSTVSDNVGRSVSYAYDLSGNLITYQDADQKTTNYIYDTKNRMIQFDKPATLGVAWVTNTYDALGRVQTQTDALGNVSQYYFAGSRTEEIKPDGTSQSWYLNREGQVIRQITKSQPRACAPGYDTCGFFEVGHQVLYFYDGRGRLSHKAFPSGADDVQKYIWESYTYDQNNNILSVTTEPTYWETWPPTPAPKLPDGTHPEKSVVAFTYDPVFNQLTSITDANGNVTTMDIDILNGNLLSIIPAGHVGGADSWTFTYNTHGQVISQNDPTNIETLYTYDPVTGSLLSATLDSTGINATKSWSYDTIGNITSRTDATGNTVTYDYDLMRRLARVTEPDVGGNNSISELDYDAEGRLLSQRNATGDVGDPWQTVTYLYDAMGNLTATTDPNGNVSTLAYDVANRLQQITDAELRNTQYTYDSLGDLSHTTDALGQASETFSWNINSVMTRVVDPQSRGAAYAYDELGRLASRTNTAELPTENFTYDQNNNLVALDIVSVNGGATQTIIYAYDNKNRVSSKTVPGAANAVSYAYDEAGKLTSVADAAVGVPVSFTYDSAGRLTSAQQAIGKTVSYEYDADGRRTKTIWPDGYFVTYSYDAEGRMSNILENGTVSLVHYTYDMLSRRTLATYGNANSSAYTYSPSNEVLDINHSFAAGEVLTFAYGYNAVSERTSEVVSDMRHVYWPAETSSLTYSTNDANQYDALKRTDLTYDGNGNLTFDNINTYTYDLENRMIGAVTATATVSYEYDGFSRRIRKTVDGVTTQFLMDGGHVIAEYDGSGALLRRYIYGVGIDQIVASVDAGGSRLYHHTEATGSVIALTDDVGTVTDRFRNDPFGITADTTGSPIRFTARRIDEETGLYYYRARYYSPQLGRFMSRDPIWYGDGMNVYAYVGNDPVNWTDPSGEIAILIPIVKGGIGAIAEVGFQLARNGGRIECIDYWDVAVSGVVGAFGPGLWGTGKNILANSKKAASSLKHAATSKVAKNVKKHLNRAKNRINAAFREAIGPTIVWQGLKYIGKKANEAYDSLFGDDGERTKSAS